MLLRCVSFLPLYLTAIFRSKFLDEMFDHGSSSIYLTLLGAFARAAYARAAYAMVHMLYMV